MPSIADMTQIKARRESRRHGRRYTRSDPPARPAARAGAGALAAVALAAWVTALAVVPAPAAAQAPSAGEQGRPQQLPAIDLTAGMHRIRAMVADDPDERATGLMWRTSMGPNEGMLFVFEQVQPVCFWMKNTLIPLSIAFVADDGRIVNLDEMQPQTTRQHCSKDPVRYVLEMNAGWFARKGVRPGDRLGGGPFRK